MTAQIYLLTAALVIAISLYGLLAPGPLLRRIIAANILSSGVFLFLVAVTDDPERAHADPVAQALVLTGIVVAVAVTAFGLALLRRLVGETGRGRLPEDDQ